MLFLACLFVGSSALSVPEIQASGKLRCGTSQNRPNIGYLNGNKVEGSEADLCTAIADVLGVSVDWKLATNVGRFSLLVDGEADVVFASSTDTVGRRGRYNISFSQPYFFDGQGFAVKKTGGVTATTIKTYCVAEASSSFENAAAHFEGGAATAITFKSVQEAVSGLASGECDAATSDALILSTFLTNDMMLLSTTISFEPLAASTRSSDADLARVVQNVLMTLFLDNANDVAGTYGSSSTINLPKAVQTVGTYDAIYKRWVSNNTRSGTRNELATLSGKGLFVSPAVENTAAPVIQWNGKDLKAVKAAGAIQCLILDSNMTSLCQTLAVALFGDKTKGTTKTSGACDVAIGVPFTYTNSSDCYAPPFAFTGAAPSMSYKTVATSGSTPDLSFFVHAVRAGLVLADQFQVTDLSAAASSLNPQVRRVLGENADVVNNYGFGDVLSTGFMNSTLREMGSLQSQLGAKFPSVFNGPYTTSPGVLWASVWNGENQPKIDKSAGWWTQVLDEGEESSCTQYFLPASSNATNKLYYFDAEDNECYDAFDVVNNRGITECIAADDTTSLFSWIFKVNKDETELFATFDAEQTAGNVSYPTSFEEATGVSLSLFERCAPPKQEEEIQYSGASSSGPLLAVAAGVMAALL